MKKTGFTRVKAVVAAVFLAGVLVTVLVVEILRARRSELVVSSGAPPASVAPPDIGGSQHRPATYSNIYRYDYVGPETCRACHARNYESWRAHPHSKMNANATAASVVGDFSGEKLEYGDGSVVFSKGVGQYRMTLYRQGDFVRQFKVTRTVGSRFVQMYVGTQTDGPERRDDAVYTREVKLPFSYGIARREWFPDSYDEQRGPELDASGKLASEYAFLGSPKSSWKQICIKCHNTYPYAERFGAAADNQLAGFPKADIALKLHAPAPPTLSDLEPYELVTLGISCESCHFGGREHALTGSAISFLPRSQDLEFPKATDELAAGARKSSYVINGICNQCHSAAGNGPLYANGASTWNSREATDMLGSACATTLACTACHNPHEAGPRVASPPDAKEHVGACVRCHAQYRDGPALLAHTRHAPAVTCLDCHMPRITHGLAGMVRTHRISSAADPRMVAKDQPNACNLCHLDRSVAWTAEQLASGWGKKIDVASLSNDPAGPRWLKHSEAPVRKVAVDAYARSAKGKSALGFVLPGLEDESAPNRMFAVLAVERLLGRPVPAGEYTPWAPPAVRRQQAARLAEQSK